MTERPKLPGSGTLPIRPSSAQVPATAAPRAPHSEDGATGRMARPRSREGGGGRALGLGLLPKEASEEKVWGKLLPLFSV